MVERAPIELVENSLLPASHPGVAVMIEACQVPNLTFG